MKRKKNNTELKLMSIFTEKINDFVSAEGDDSFFNKEQRTKRDKLSESQLLEKVEEINIDDEVGFVEIKEMRRIIKSLIKKGIEDEY
tara:strand:- start:113 stop:373 length:261 start_codon:yes stop_codon:yes gene_type:complete